MFAHIRSKVKCQKGFTLVELVVVIAILGILAAIAVPKLNTSTESAKNAKLKSDLRTVDSALAIYYSNNGQYPTNLDALVTANLLVSVPIDATGAALTYSPKTAGTPTKNVGYTLTGGKVPSGSEISPGSN